MLQGRKIEKWPGTISSQYQEDLMIMMLGARTWVATVDLFLHLAQK